ncbi:MAG: FAD-dependent oxidoreductase [Gammaproteobacteria bacterium]|nr:FAD-dependent oxidoreductase [Gammaproteobacteria bacterium]
MTIEKIQRIGIIGAGFSGTSLAFALSQLAQKSLEVILFEKSGDFGAGPAYATPFPYHLLNVRAKDMSIYELESQHFVNWLTTHTAKLNLSLKAPLADQFVSRMLYRLYLQDLLTELSLTSNSNIKLHCVEAEVVDLKTMSHHILLQTKAGATFTVDQVVLALGNLPPSHFPFPHDSSMPVINNPWEYRAVENIPETANVMIVGTGLSMIDTVLTLHQRRHRGKIIAVSRHGLLPLPHSCANAQFTLNPSQFPLRLHHLTRWLRKMIREYEAEGGDWREIIHAFRNDVPHVWQKLTLTDKKRFLRHMVPLWNVHRHRVHDEIDALLKQMMSTGQLSILSGRVLKSDPQGTQIKLRHTEEIKSFSIDWLVNCMGPRSLLSTRTTPLISNLLARHFATLDPLHMGFAVNSTGALQNKEQKDSKVIFTLGPLRKGSVFESGAVPEIRKQAFELAQTLLHS